MAGVWGWEFEGRFVAELEWVFGCCEGEGQAKGELLTVNLAGILSSGSIK